MTPARIRERIQALSTLKSGWLDGDGEQLPPEGVVWAAEFFGLLVEAHRLPPPYTYPTPEGGLSLEWPLGDWEVGVEVNLRTHKAEALAVHCGAERLPTRELTVDLDVSVEPLLWFLNEFIPR